MNEDENDDLVFEGDLLYSSPFEDINEALLLK